MKYLFGILLTLAVVSGCTSEISDGCPLFDNVVLNFRYPDETGKDIFRENIDLVDVLVFTGEGYYYDWKILPKDSLDKFQGTVLAVEPGEYMIVCWGNVSEGLSDGTAAIKDYRVVNSGTYPGQALHYAPRKTYTAHGGSSDYSIYRVIAPEKGINETTYDFRPAYWRVNVYVSGFKERDGSEGLPKVQLTDMLEGYDFLLDPLASNVDFETAAETVVTTEGKWAFAGFNVPYFSTEDDINVNIRNNSDGTVVGFVNMKDFLSQHQRTLSYEKVEVIDILISFTEFGVTVSVPNWDTVGIVPDL